jgi:hypothetical protein
MIMKNIIKIACYSIVIILATACQNDSILEWDISKPIVIQDDQLYFIPDTSFFVFTYDGKTYVYEPAAKNVDREFTLRSSYQKGNALYQELLRKKNTCTVVKKDGSLDVQFEFNSNQTWYSEDMPFSGSGLANLKVRSFIFQYSHNTVWPDNATAMVLLSENPAISGVCIIYEKELEKTPPFLNAIGEEQLSRYGWADRIQAVRVLLLIPAYG